ncbi:hypothetical protein [Helicobacter winghamensis]|uniref:hypothetical protein n=1 Tax=Helicobacter winghamensis TaxID=157268 RepID=UPI0018A61BB4|nr:hypothetical protein [Helicobacter winghamensis]QOQ98629.1 hypothetical protein A0Z60_03425 [Helicobacter winghamensis]
MQNNVQLTQRGGGANPSYQPLKRLTSSLFYGSLVLTTLLTNVNADDIEIQKGQSENRVDISNGVTKDNVIINGTVGPQGIHNNGTINNDITINQGGSVTGGIHNNKGATISGNVDIKGALVGRVNNASNIKGDVIVDGGSIDVGVNNQRVNAIGNEGTIDGSIHIKNGTVTGGNNFSSYGHVAVYNSGTINKDIKVDRDAILNGGIVIHNLNQGGRGTIKGSIDVGGNIKGTNVGILNWMSTIEGGISVKDTANITGDIWNRYGGKINGKIEVDGKVNGSINNGSVGSNNTGTTIGKGIEISANGNVTGNIDNRNNGEIKEGIAVNGGSLGGNIQNSGTISQISINGSSVGGDIKNSGTNAKTGNITINNGGSVGGSIINENGANYEATNTITLDKGSSLGGIQNKGANSTFSAKLDLKGNVGTISNEGTFNSDLNLSNGASVQAINNNGGTISKDISINSNAKVGTISNAVGAIIAKNISVNNATLTSIDNKGTIQEAIKLENGTIGDITNSGTITNGITASNGTINKITNSDSGTISKEISISSNANVGAISNSGTIQEAIRLNSGILTALSNAKNATIKEVNISNNSKVGNITNEGTITNGITIDKASLEGNITNSGNLSKIDVNNGGNITGNITYSNNAKGNLTIKEGGKVAGAFINEKNSTFNDAIKVEKNASLGGVVNKGTFSGSLTVDKGGEVGYISYEEGSTFNGTLDIKGEVGGISNKGNFNGTIKVDSILKALSNEGTIKEVELANTAKLDALINEGTINDKLTNKGELAQLANSGTLENGFQSDSQKDTTLINSGNINKGITNNGTGKLTLANSGTITNGITNNTNANLTLVNQKNITGDITNATKANLELSNSGNISGNVTNTGTLTLANAGEVTGDITNNANANLTLENHKDISGSITNSGELTLTNTGNIINGITNTGTMTLASSIDNGITRAVSNLANGIIGKNNNGVQLENNGVNAKLSIKDWYFKAPEFTTNDERKDGSLLVGGDNIAGISLEKVYINTEDLDIDKIYDSNTFFADKDGNAVGEQINTNQGIDANNIHSISGIYTFESANNNGGYRAKINRAELSGKTLAQSVVYSSRLRNMSVSNLLRATTTQNFATNFNAIKDMELSKEGEAPTDADVLSELEKLYINHNNLESKNHSFVIPYYQYFSADMEGGSGKLKSNSAGMLIGTQRLLPNDYGILGVYGGFESADQDVSNQRLEFDNKSYFGGLSYYDIFYRKGLTQYFVSLTTNLDYTNADVSKTYTDGVTKVDSTAKIYGYGVNARVGLSHYVLHNYLRVTPEIGFNYLGMHSKDFTLQHLGGTNEHYKAQYFNFIDTVASIKIESPYSNRLRTSFSVGGLYNIYKDAEGRLKLDRNILTSEIDVARWYAFVQMGLSYDFLENANLSLNYNGISTLSSKANSHSVFVKFAWWW